MKKVLSLLLVLLILVGLVGCSGNSKSEEELKAEIKAEMEAKLKEELKEELKAEMEGEKGDDNSPGNSPEPSKIEQNGPVNGETVNGAGDNQGSSSQPSTADGGALYLSNLKNGDSIGGGLTIGDINYKKGSESASFTMKGTTELTGELYYDEEDDDYMFLVTEGRPNEIAIEWPNGDVFNFELSFMGFRNLDTLINKISSGDRSNIKNGSRMELKLKVKDIKFSGHFGSEYGVWAEFIEIIDGNQGSNTQSSEGKLLENYELNKEYKLSNLNQSGELDTFKVYHSDINAPQQELYLIVNGKRFDFTGIEPELVSSTKYKIAYSNDPGGYVFVIPFANPPSGPDQIYFYGYSPNYSVEGLGLITYDFDIESMNIQSINYSEANINNKIFILESMW